MALLKDQAQIDEMRRRLYERGATSQPLERHNLSPVAQNAPTAWPIAKPATVPEPLVDHRKDCLLYTSPSPRDH
jgi:hypothetical protein